LHQARMGRVLDRLGAAFDWGHGEVDARLCWGSVSAPGRTFDRVGYR
jgi:hypothetical protein